MTATATLPDLLAALCDTGNASMLPAGEPWQAMIARTRQTGRAHRVKQDTYWYWLEVLPPRWQGFGCFCFAEGCEPFRFFWKLAGRYYTRSLTWEETAEFCRLAGIPLPH